MFTFYPFPRHQGIFPFLLYIPFACISVPNLFRAPVLKWINSEVCAAWCDLVKYGMLGHERRRLCPHNPGPRIANSLRNWSAWEYGQMGSEQEACSLGSWQDGNIKSPILKFSWCSPRAQCSGGGCLWNVTSVFCVTAATMAGTPGGWDGEE